MNLADLQKKLKTARLDGYLVTRNNMFLGQDVREDENLIQKLTGFSGSDGLLLLLRNKAVLFVDGRYELQAPAETNPQDVEVFCTKQTSFLSWLKQNTHDLKRFRLGINPWCHSAEMTDNLKVNNLEVIFVPDFLPPLLSSTPANVFEHHLEFSGEDVSDKIKRLTQVLEESDTDGIFLSQADSVSWLFNLRSDALPESPIIRAMALVSKDGKAWLFGDNLNTSDLKLNYPLLALSEIPAVLRHFKKKSLAIDPQTNSAALFELLNKNKISTHIMADPSQSFKAVKNQTELAGIRQAHIRDAVAIIKLLHWLEKNYRGKTEQDIADKLHHFRAQGDNYFAESFTTIAASGPNAAIVHYHPTPKTNRTLDNNSLLLLDSGAQYYDGTTDITRTIALGIPSRQMIEDFTIVLKSHIALNSAIFPVSASGAELDTLARAPLWKMGKDYNHGTGHGVGCFLNVHEGPQRIARKNSSYSLAAGMITSIEPGYYEENNYGIRIENLVEIVENTPDSPDGYLKFENLTLVPIDKRLINKYLLSDGEINWLNDYHRRVEKTLSPLLTSAEKSWLKEACSPL